MSDNRKNESFSKHHPLASGMGERIARSSAVLDNCAEGRTYAGYEVQTLKIKFTGLPGTEHLAVVTGLDPDGGPVVAFHSAITVTQLLMGLAARIENGSLKWRDDEFRR